MVTDARTDARAGGLELTRAQLGRASDGRLRAVFTLAAGFDVLDLLADDGPPGSLCLRLWTVRGAKPSEVPPDHLVCVSGARSGAAYRSSVSRLTLDSEPRRQGGGAVTRPSTRSLAVTFAKGLIGSPRSLRFAADATRPGCTRTSCTDVAPEVPRTVVFNP